MNRDIRNGIQPLADRHAERVNDELNSPQNLQSWDDYRARNAPDNPANSQGMNEHEFCETYERMRNWFIGTLLFVTLGGVLVYYLR